MGTRQGRHRGPRKRRLFPVQGSRHTKRGRRVEGKFRSWSDCGNRRSASSQTRKSPTRPRPDEILDPEWRTVPGVRPSPQGVAQPAGSAHDPGQRGAANLAAMGTVGVHHRRTEQPLGSIRTGRKWPPRRPPHGDARRRV